MAMLGLNSITKEYAFIYKTRTCGPKPTIQGQLAGKVSFLVFAYPNNLYRTPFDSACLMEYQVVAYLFDLLEIFGMINRSVQIRQWKGIGK
jgi:hypothetical protein